MNVARTMAPTVSAMPLFTTTGQDRACIMTLGVGVKSKGSTSDEVPCYVLFVLKLHLLDVYSPLSLF
jgi:hypothetical protein